MSVIYIHMYMQKLLATKLLSISSTKYVKQYQQQAILKVNFFSLKIVQFNKWLAVV